MTVVRSLLYFATFHFLLAHVNASINSNKQPIEEINNMESKADPRIIGGEVIPISRAPWQVSVRLIENELISYGSGHICGGSVITQRVVVTAAHCIANTAFSSLVYRSASEFTLVMGTAYLYEVTKNTLQYYVLEISVNRKFSLTTLNDDIALFFINGYIPLDWPTVAPVPLNLNMEQNGTMCTVTGWGTTGYNYVSSVLMGASVPIVSFAVCSTSYNILSPSMLCAGYMQTGDVDACQGDSGGPLVCNGFLAGIVSWGNKCAEPGYPGVYTNVSYMRNWISEANSTFNYSYYQTGNATNIRGLRSLTLVLILLHIFHFYVLKR